MCSARTRWHLTQPGMDWLCIGTTLDWAPQRGSLAVGLGGEGMLHHKKWPLELALFRQNPKTTDEAVSDRVKSAFLLALRALITVCVQTATVSWLMQYPVRRESRRFGCDQTEQFLGRASAVPACSSSVAFKPKLLSRSLTATDELILPDLVYTVFKHISTVHL